MEEEPTLEPVDSGDTPCDSDPVAIASSKLRFMRLPRSIRDDDSSDDDDDDDDGGGGGGEGVLSDDVGDWRCFEIDEAAKARAMQALEEELAAFEYDEAAGAATQARAVEVLETELGVGTEDLADLSEELRKLKDDLSAGERGGTGQRTEAGGGGGGGAGGPEEEGAGLIGSGGEGDMEELAEELGRPLTALERRCVGSAGDLFLALAGAAAALIAEIGDTGMTPEWEAAWASLRDEPSFGLAAYEARGHRIRGACEAMCRVQEQRFAVEERDALHRRQQAHLMLKHREQMLRLEEKLQRQEKQEDEDEEDEEDGEKEEGGKGGGGKGEGKGFEQQEEQQEQDRSQEAFEGKEGSGEAELKEAGRRLRRAARANERFVVAAEERRREVAAARGEWEALQARQKEEREADGQRGAVGGGLEGALREAAAAAAALDGTESAALVELIRLRVREKSPPEMAMEVEE